MNKMKWIICPCCEGNGQVEHSAFSNGFTSSEWADMHEDEQDTYLSGGYDVRCDECSGTGKVQVPDVARMTFAEKRLLVIERQEARDDARFTRELHAEWAAERAFGC